MPHNCLVLVLQHLLRGQGLRLRLVLQVKVLLLAGRRVVLHGSAHCWIPEVAQVFVFILHYLEASHLQIGGGSAALRLLLGLLRPARLINCLLQQLDLAQVAPNLLQVLALLLFVRELTNFLHRFGT